MRKSNLENTSKLKDIFRIYGNKFDDDGYKLGDVEQEKKHYKGEIDKEEKQYKILLADLEYLFDQVKLQCLKNDLTKSLEKSKVEFTVRNRLKNEIEKLNHGNISLVWLLITQIDQKDLKSSLTKIFTFHVDLLTAKKMAEMAALQHRLNGYQEKLKLGYMNWYQGSEARSHSSLFGKYEKAFESLETHLRNLAPTTVFFSSKKDKLEVNNKTQVAANKKNDFNEFDVDFYKKLN